MIIIATDSEKRTNYFIEKLSFAASNGFTLDTKEDIEELASFLSDEINKEW